MSDIQDRIARAVEARGYRKGYERYDSAFIARQLCKATEELAEAARAIEWGQPHYWARNLEIAGDLARDDFDKERIHWTGEAADIYPTDLAAELVDVLIPLFVAADVLGVDLLALAVSKAERDVERGVR